jgi:NADH:ubiquinone oxidoreductase subunit K
MTIGPSAYLLLSAILFGIGVAGVVTRRNVLIILMSVEVMLNGVNVAFVAAGSYFATPPEGSSPSWSSPSRRRRRRWGWPS